MANNENADPNASSMEVDVEDHVIDSDEEGGLRVDDDIYIPPPPRNIEEADPNGPRLMITKIVNVNFKSYAGTQVIGPFHKCFSAIVGPNGSGKSNVIDSMLFVFGYRASKIRSKKISVLIHNSSEHPNCTSCTVSVHFQKIIDKPGSEYEVVPNSEFVISRTAFKDNSAFYELNKKKVQFKEIGKCLRSHGVDLDHNRFLILQGEVEQIAMMKPKAQGENDTGMLEFLEDIIGTTRYKEPLDKLFEKVEVLTEYRVQKLNRLRIIEKEKAALQEPMQEAVQYLKLENSIAKLQNELYHCKRHLTAKEVEEQGQKVAELDKDLTDLASEIKTVHSEKEEKNKVMKEKGKAWNELQQQKDEATAKFDKIRKLDETLHAELVETNKRRKANISTLKTEKTKLEDLQKIPEKNAKTIEECETLVEKLVKNQKSEEETLTSLMAGLKEKTQPLLEQRAKLEKDLVSLRNNVDKAQSSFDIANSELELYTSLEHTEKEKLAQLKEALKTTTETLTNRQEQLALFDKKIPASEQSLQKAQNELAAIKSQENEMMTKLKKMRISFEEQKSAMHASRSRNRILDSLMREKREGRLPGIFGRLGDLGAINGKYDVAVSTACGPLDNIVVDTVATARECITFLRQNDIGRATFIALEKQEHLWPRCRAKINAPENVHRLFDLIEVEDERILPAFYYGLQDTLVANDLDQATRIAYGAKRYRVVTLKGELIELSGTMSGGGRTVLKGRMGQKVVRNEPTPAEIEKLQANLDTVFEECNRLRAKQQPVENQIHVLSTALKDMTVDSQKFKVELKTLKQQEPSLRKQVQDQEKKAAEAVSDPKKVQQMQKVLSTAKEHLEKVEEASKSVETEVALLNRKIEEISGSRVKDQQQKISNLTKQIDKARAEICRLQVATKTAQRNLQKTEQRIETLENDVQTCEQRLRDIQKEKQEIEEEAKSILAEIEKYKEGLEERDEALSSFKKELDALQARENKMKSVKIDLDQKLVDAKKVLRELEQQIPEYTRRIKELKLQVIPDETAEEMEEFTEEQLAEMDEKKIIANLQKAKKRLPETVPNMQIIAQYREKDAEYLKRAADLEEITTKRDNLREVYENARRRRRQEFLVGFTIITDKLKEMYQMITLGGDAELELMDSLDPFSEGIVFSVRPPKKSWKNICNLSGGEKTLSSLALVFALHHYKPTPLYFMDEIDAALDFKNVSIVANYIKERTKNAQFIVISLRSNMFELANYLVGIYKTYNGTKSVTVDVEMYYEKNGISPPTQHTWQSTYSSQMQRLTCPGTQTQKQSQDTQRTTQTGKNNRETVISSDLNLPDLGLCPTPTKKTTTESNHLSQGSDNSSDEPSSTSKPSKKKRRL